MGIRSPRCAEGVVKLTWLDEGFENLEVPA